MLEKIKESWKGVLLCVLIAVPSFFLGKQIPVIGGPIFGIVFGMILTSFIKDKTNYASGIKFSSKKILQYAVILLGFGLNLSVILKTGAESLPVIISTISISLIVAFAMSKIMKIDSKVATLVGVGSSICGGSAIAATAPVIKADSDEIASSISVIFLFNVIAALIFPTLGSMLGLTNEGFGIFAGSAINDTSSVSAAASSWDGIHGSNTLEIATIVKLTRTLAIIPICLALAFYEIKKEKSKNPDAQKTSLKGILPSFIILFLLASLISTIFTIPANIVSILKTTSKFFIVIAMSAIGLNTNFVKLIKTGKKAIVLGFACWISIASVALLVQYLFGIL